MADMSCVKSSTIISIKITEWLILEGTSGHHLVQFPQLMEGHLELFAQDCIQMALEYLQGWTVHNIFG